MWRTGPLFFGGSAVPPTPVGLFTPSVALGTDDSNPGASFRNICTLAGNSNGQIQVTFQASATNALTISDAALGEWTTVASNAPTINTPIQLTFSGSSTVLIAPGGSATSDFVNFSFATPRKLVVIVDCANVVGHGGNKFSTGDTNCDCWFLSPGATFNNASPTGMTSLATKDYMVSAIYTNGGAFIYNDLDWPSASNRPTLSGSTLTWVGPSGGGANNGNPVLQTRTLTSQAGITITSSTQGIHFTSGCTITGSNITVKQCVIFEDAQNILTVSDSASNIVIEDCLIYGPGASGTNNGGGQGINLGSSNGFGNVTIRRCHVHDARLLCSINGGGPTTGATLSITDCWMHDCNDNSPGTSHYEPIYFGGGNTGSILIQHNFLNENVYNQTAALFIETFFGSISNMTVSDNKLSGGGGTIYCNNAGNGFGDPVVSLTNNLMGNFQQGFLASINSTQVTATGNADINTGANVDSSL